MGRALALVLLVATSGACGRSTSDGDAASAASATDSSAFVKKVAGPATDSLETLASVRDVTITGECPDPGASAAADIAAQAAATIPLKVGLTLSHMWKAYEGDYEHECLEQVRAIDARSVLTTGSCPTGKERVMSHWTRRLCRTDLTDSYIYLTSSHAKYPETFRGALKFSMSSASFATLKRDGKVRHRYLDIASRTDSLLVLDRDVDGVLETQDKGTFKLVVNDTAVDVPVIEAMHQNGRKGELIRVKVLDDARFPLMLDYYHPASHFFITYTKVTYPTEHEIEKQLAKDKHVDVYGIYFDFASDSLRPESAPILHEIATALAGHPEWKVTITGHTDSIGGSASNLDLSRRRSARVRRALVEQYRTDSLRISTSGSGDSQPKDVNTTPEGRARNRRVELVRD
ncbi:MAG: OmpA/MotB protein [Gemmatimonadetes bacterium]|nr:OmpA/MotB protein [Gemmatimonadota bacterium]